MVLRLNLGSLNKQVRALQKRHSHLIQAFTSRLQPNLKAEDILNNTKILEEKVCKYNSQEEIRKAFKEVRSYIRSLESEKEEKTRKFEKENFKLKQKILQLKEDLANWEYEAWKSENAKKKMEGQKREMVIVTNELEKTKSDMKKLKKMLSSDITSFVNKEHFRWKSQRSSADFQPLDEIVEYAKLAVRGMNGVDKAYEKGKSLERVLRKQKHTKVRLERALTLYEKYDQKYLFETPVKDTVGRSEEGGLIEEKYERDLEEKELIKRLVEEFENGCIKQLKEVNLKLNQFENKYKRIGQLFLMKLKSNLGVIFEMNKSLTEAINEAKIANETSEYNEYLEMTLFTQEKLNSEEKEKLLHEIKLLREALGDLHIMRKDIEVAEPLLQEVGETSLESTTKEKQIESREGESFLLSKSTDQFTNTNLQEIFENIFILFNEFMSKYEQKEMIINNQLEAFECIIQTKLNESCDKKRALEKQLLQKEETLEQYINRISELETLERNMTNELEKLPELLKYKTENESLISQLETLEREYKKMQEDSELKLSSVKSELELEKNNRKELERANENLSIEIHQYCEQIVQISKEKDQISERLMTALESPEHKKNDELQEEIFSLESDINDIQKQYSNLMVKYNELSSEKEQPSLVVGKYKINLSELNNKADERDCGAPTSRKYR